MAQDQIQEIKNKLDITSVISSYLPLKKSGKNYKALCPFHVEKAPSFMVSPDLQIFKCFGCGEGGDVISFYSKMEGVSFSEALREMAKRAGVKLVRRKKTPEEERKESLFQINQLAADYFHHLLKNHQVGEKAERFLKRRGLSPKTAEIFGLGYAPSSWDSLGKYIMSKNYTLTEYLFSGLGVKKEKGRGFYDFLRGRIIFPLRSSTGRVVGFSARTLGAEEPKYINTPETPVFEKRRFLYNLDLAKQEIKRSREAVLVEGEMDAIALFEKGIKNVVAAKGTALTQDQAALIARFADTVKICFDRDAAGLEATKKGILLAQSVGLEIKAVLLPQGKDPDEAIRKDEKSFRQALDKAPPIFDFYLDSGLERFDHTTASGKKKIAAELLPVLKSLANEVERAAYLKKLSEVLNIPEESLWRQLEKEEALEVGRPQVAEIVLSYPKREARFLARILSLAPSEARRWLRKLTADDFSDPRLKIIFTQLKSYLSQIKRFSLKNFSAKLNKEQQTVLEELTLIPLPVPDHSWPLREISPDEELKESLKALRRLNLKRQWRELVGQVKQAEREKQGKEVKRLQREVLKLSEKIAEL